MQSTINEIIHNVTKNLEAVTKKPLSKTKRTAIEDGVNEYFDGRAGILWTEYDVQNVATDKYGVELTKDEVDTVLYNIVNNHNCEQGITWIEIEFAVEDVLSNREI